MQVYSTVHAGPKSQGGGVQEGFLIVGYLARAGEGGRQGSGRGGGGGGAEGGAAGAAQPRRAKTHHSLTSSRIERPMPMPVRSGRPMNGTTLITLPILVPGTAAAPKAS
jgi:hypothetical protein